MRYVQLVALGIASSNACHHRLQGIRTVSTFLGYEASRNLEQQTFEGVSFRVTPISFC